VVGGETGHTKVCTVKQEECVHHTLRIMMVASKDRPL
jgi:hypothetical protein